jgi:large subunit ribosomal protein L7/L12
MSDEAKTFSAEIKELGDKIVALTLMQAKDLVDNCPKPVKEGLTKDEAETIKQQLEAAGAVVELA